MQRYYDSKFNRLIYVDKAATDQFWDEHWQMDDFRKAITSTPNSWVAKITKKYLSIGSRILEGGCGQANNVYALHKSGFDVIGLDYASETVKKIQTNAPELSIKLGDVRKLPFDDNYFDGYWSIGVIEHFWKGYDDIALEMERVIRIGGYLFITFPVMSSLRKWRAKNNKFKKFEDYKSEPDGFYQFALSPSSVIQHFNSLGFELIDSQGLDGIKGIKDEILFFNKLFNKIYNSKKFTVRALGKIIDIIFAHHCGHTKLLVLRRK